MTAQVLPLRTDAPRYSIRVELDSLRYQFSFEWNDRAASWFFDLDDSNGDRLLSTVRVSTDWPLLDRFRFDSRVPRGVLVAIDTQKTDYDPAREDLGARVQLIYYPLADVPAELQAIREAR